MNLSDLTPDPNNANRGTERGNSALEASLQQYGAGRSILVDKNDTIIAGNKTAEMAGQLGMMNVKVVETTGDELVAVKRTDLDLETDASAREMAYADNRVGELSLDWDADALLNDIENGIDIGKFFSDNEVDKLLGPKPTEDVPAPDATAELQEKWGTERGQVWTIGRHRLMCGDSTSDAEVLMGGAVVDMVFTSPPYNVDVQYASHDDKEKPMDEYLQFLSDVVLCSINHMQEGGAFAWNIGVSKRTFPHHHVNMLEALGLRYNRQYVWAKVGVPVPAWYHTTNKRKARYVTSNYTHELVFVMSNGEMIEGGDSQPNDVLANDVIRINQTMATRDLPSGPSKSGSGKVINLDRRANKAHPAAFPVLLPSAFMSAYSATDEIVYDPFVGSGTTMVAAEQLDRTCYGMEIDPGYCAVVLERMNLMGFEGTIAV